jgi:hypothetical protein
MLERPRFEALKLELQRGGIAVTYIDRTLRELSDHYDDLERAARDAGYGVDDAAEVARTQLGNHLVIAAAVLAQPRLKSWSYRWPMIALCMRSAVAIGGLPARPVLYVAGRSDELARWGGAIGAALVVVGSLYSMLNWMIMIG